MGYTHYWYRKNEVPADKMLAIVADFAKVRLATEDRLPLAGPDGQEPFEDPLSGEADGIFFNGVTGCGHPRKHLGIAWPDDGAGGQNNPFQGSAESGQWFAGALLKNRDCGGDCSHESFWFPQVLDEAGDKIFQCCKTAYKPYDLMVTAVLVIAKHHLGPDIRVQSDGTDAEWFDGKTLVNLVCGYGLGFKLDPEA